MDSTLDLHVGFFFAGAAFERHVSDSFQAPGSAAADLDAVLGEIEGGSAPHVTDLDDAAGPHTTSERWARRVQGIGAIGK